MTRHNSSKRRTHRTPTFNAPQAPQIVQNPSGNSPGFGNALGVGLGLGFGEAAGESLFDEFFGGKRGRSSRRKTRRSKKKKRRTTKRRNRSRGGNLQEKLRRMREEREDYGRRVAELQAEIEHDKSMLNRS